MAEPQKKLVAGDRFSHEITVVPSEAPSSQAADPGQLMKDRCVTQRPGTRCQCGMYDLQWV